MAKTKKKRTVPTLTPDQIRHLRGLGHHLKPLAMLGREGITDNLIKAVEEVLNAHELIKVKIQENFPDDRHVGAEAVARACSAALAQVLGRTFLIYRPNPDLPTERRILLPKK